MDWVKNYPQIKGVLLCPGTGQSGFEALAAWSPVRSIPPAVPLTPTLLT